ncbi:DUF47 domain-containing protein [Pectinatus frisingensis]|uniref:DUF47 domain-containing protein n=1 Tax=Pectinatus frisingensis TaxID=865 RepID=UPI0018C61942|nr:DUF47 family protein [Pectinatus frisingensis]
MFLVKKNTDFYDLFAQSANYFHKGALVINEVMSDYRGAEEKMKAITDLEHAADNINDKIIDKLNHTFITPIDREDIYAIANGLDDGVDFLQGTLQRAIMYHISEIRPTALEMSQLLIEATADITEIFKLLHKLHQNEKKILNYTARICKIESAGDKLYREEVAQLFTTVKDPIEIIKWKDILEYLENTLDHCESIADMIRGVVMKYA